MVLINMDRVYELTILLCGLHRERGGGERERKRERGWGLIENACKSFLPNMKMGVLERKESTLEERVGGEVLVGVAENRRHNDSRERRAGDWIKCLS